MIKHHISNKDLLENIQGEILKSLFKGLKTSYKKKVFISKGKYFFVL
jgi:hypothetical protein